jgi:HPt (histidine-containing phosphotransfer) domain-containing protein
MAEPVILDQGVISSLRQLTPPGEPDVLAEVLRLFLQEAPPRIERLRNAWAGGNIEEMRRVAHSLKGSAGNIGARRLYDVCRRLDEQGRSDDRSGVGPLIDELAAEFTSVESAHRSVTT